MRKFCPSACPGCWRTNRNGIVWSGDISSAISKRGKRRLRSNGAVGGEGQVGEDDHQRRRQMQVADERLTINWCGDVARSRELGGFFAQNVDAQYISHSELQGQRALSPGQWCDGLPDILSREIESRLGQAAGQAPARTSQPILVAEKQGALVGLSFVTFA